uniref:Uncharacterized protein n=1 Tax=Pyricularia oryzae (strain 70-15 / ATCC MYA-4617 / FGSC 8958) TaxID=242507 RepID=Q2KHH3_PYRO7|nr:hypothetical protein MGCH7_ch7g12 [Pyricularia oryzae 70-15]
MLFACTVRAQGEQCANPLSNGQKRRNSKYYVRGCIAGLTQGWPRKKRALESNQLYGGLARMGRIYLVALIPNTSNLTL